VRLRTAADITCSASAVAAAVIALDRDCVMSSLLSFVVVLISAQWCPLVLRVPLISLCTLQRAPFRKQTSIVSSCGAAAAAAAAASSSASSRRMHHSLSTIFNVACYYSARLVLLLCL
jgi:hypothetical protein